MARDSVFWGAELKTKERTLNRNVFNNLRSPFKSFEEDRIKVKTSDQNKRAGVCECFL